MGKSSKTIVLSPEKPGAAESKSDNEDAETIKNVYGKIELLSDSIMHRNADDNFFLYGEAKFLYTKLRGPSHGIFVWCIALKAESKTLTCLMFTFIICQNTHSTNPTCDLNSVTKL